MVEVAILCWDTKGTMGAILDTEEVWIWVPTKVAPLGIRLWLESEAEEGTRVSDSVSESLSLLS